MTRCKLGFMVDSGVCVFATIVGVEKNQIKVKLDVTMAIDELNNNPNMYSPIALMVAKIAEIHQMKPVRYRCETYRNLALAGDWAQKAYLDFYYNDFINRTAFKGLKETGKFNFLNHSYVYLDIRPEDKISKHLDGGPQIFTMPVKYEKGSGVKVFDNVNGFTGLEGSGYGYMVERLLLKYQSYCNRIKRAIEYNEVSPCKINMISRSYAGFTSFWRNEKHPMDSDNYVASGLTVIMEKLTIKPNSRDDFLKGLDQLVIMDHAGVANFELDYDDMFMKHGEFIFCGFGSSDSPSDKGDDRTYILDRQVAKFVKLFRDRGLEVPDEYVTDRVGYFKDKLDWELTKQQMASLNAQYEET